MTSPDIQLEHRIASRLLDVLIRAGLIVALALLCYRVFSPFLTLMVWALILAVTLFPLHQMLAAKMGGRQGWAATVLTLLGVALIVAPTAVSDEFARRLGATAGHRRAERHAGDPAAARRGRRVAAGRKPGACALVQGPCRPSCPDQEHAAADRRHRQVGTCLRRRHRRRAAGVRRLLHHRRDHHGLREGGSGASLAIFSRIVGPERGPEFTKLSTATIRAVAAGVLGVALIQAIVVGLCLLLASIPFAGVLAVIVLVLGIAQVPALLVTLPAIAYIWTTGDYGTGEAALYTVLLFVAGMADNVLKPLMLGRGVDAPMPVILIGALGGMAVSGILGMFVGATLLALGYQIFMGWVHTDPDAGNRRRKERGKEQEARRRLSQCAPPRRGAGCRSACCWRACLLLGACTTVGPDFARPEVPWLKDWSSSTLRSESAAGSVARARVDRGVVAQLQ